MRQAAAFDTAPDLSSLFTNADTPETWPSGPAGGSRRDTDALKKIVAYLKERKLVAGCSAHKLNTPVTCRAEKVDLDFQITDDVKIVKGIFARGIKRDRPWRA